MNFACTVTAQRPEARAASRSATERHSNDSPAACMTYTTTVSRRFPSPSPTHDAQKFPLVEVRHYDSDPRSMKHVHRFLFFAFVFAATISTEQQNPTRKFLSEANWGKIHEGDM